MKELQHQNGVLLCWFVVLVAALGTFLYEWLKVHQSGLFLCILVLLGSVLAICLHEWGHAIAAHGGGDQSVKAKGYLALNPLKYTDISTSLVLPVVFLLLGNLALPGSTVYINSKSLRGRVWQSAVSLAGPGMTALIILFLSIPFHLGFSIYAHGWFWSGLAALAQIEIAALLLNLLPVPALDGYGILEPWLPQSIQQYLQGMKKYGFLFVLTIFLTSPNYARWFWEVSLAIAELLGIPLDLAVEGQTIFRDYRFSLLPLLLGWAILYKQFNKHPTTGSKEKQLRGQGISLLEQEQYQQAQEHYQQALTDYPEDANLRLNYGLALAFQDQFEAAIVEYDQVLTQIPEDQAASHYKADALLELKQYEAALALFDSILAHSPHSSHFLYDRGFVLQKLGRDEDSISCYEQATHHEPLNDLYWGALVTVQQKLGKMYASDKNLEAGLRRNAKSEHLWQLKLWRCLNEYRYGDFFETCERFEAATEGQLALPLAYQAIGLGEVQHYSQAMLAFKEAINRKTHQVLVLAHQANCLIEMKCYEKALATLDQIVANAESDRALCLEVKAQGLVGLKRYREALAIYEELLRKDYLNDDDRVRTLVNRGSALQKQGDAQAALASHEQALALRPNDTHALSNRGDVLIQLGQIQAGLADQNRAVELKPEQPQGLKARGDSLRKLGQHQLAIESYQQSLSIKPDIEILCHQAICFLALEEPERAAQALQEAQALHQPTTSRTIAEKSELAELWQMQMAMHQPSKRVLYLYWLEFFQALELID